MDEVLWEDAALTVRRLNIRKRKIESILVNPLTILTLGTNEYEGTTIKIMPSHDLLHGPIYDLLRSEHEWINRKLFELNKPQDMTIDDLQQLYNEVRHSDPGFSDEEQTTREI